MNFLLETNKIFNSLFTLHTFVITLLYKWKTDDILYLIFEIIYSTNNTYNQAFEIERQAYRILHPLWCKMSLAIFSFVCYKLKLIVYIYNTLQHYTKAFLLLYFKHMDID